MQAERHEVLVRLDNPEAIEKVRAVVREINGCETPEFTNETFLKLTLLGDGMACVRCMAAGASMTM